MRRLGRLSINLAVDAVQQPNQSLTLPANAGFVNAQDAGPLNGGSLTDRFEGFKYLFGWI